MIEMRALRSVVTVLALLGAIPACAETPADRTGTGGGPNSAITAPNTTATGTTKPPGVEEGPATPRERRELDRIKRENNQIDDSICDGCK